MSETVETAPLILGTRGSDLALAQETMVRAALEAASDRPVERRIIKTTGDQRQDLKLTAFSQPTAEGGPLLDKGIFTKELEEALRAGEIDAAVHSLKDVPTELEPGFAIAGVLERAAIEDVLLCVSSPGGESEPLTLESLPAGARVGTGSVRRQRLVKHFRPDLEIAEIRGNVPTRVRKLVESGEYDAILLARAGLERLGHGRLAEGVLEFEGRDLSAAILPADRFYPAASQGIVGIEIRSDDEAARRAVEAITHPETMACAVAERAFLLRLQAGCQTPVGVHTWIDAERGVLGMKAIVFNETDGAEPPKTGSLEGALDDPGTLGANLVNELG